MGILFSLNHVLHSRYGDCCDNPKLVTAGTHCGGSAFGYNAETQPPSDAPVTFWELGSIQEVAWVLGANHEGGYSYRLCRIPDGKLSWVSFRIRP